MSKITNRIIRKALFALTGTALGGIAGASVADGLETVFSISDQATESLFETGITHSGAWAGAWAGESMEEATWSEKPPSNPIEGKTWRPSGTDKLFVWTGSNWLEAIW